ncbi:MAG: circadian clock KaiB family protein [Cyanobacteria bacterium P01_H01_bin.121]
MTAPFPLQASVTVANPGSQDNGRDRQPVQGFKGIALFTPGGDLIYGREVEKQRRWHADLCLALQDLLALPEPPYFLVPHYTATLDYSFHPVTGQPYSVAEAYPAAYRYRQHLAALFEVWDCDWRCLPAEAGKDWQTVETYREVFPELWQPHNLVVPWQMAKQVRSQLERAIAHPAQAATVPTTQAAPEPELPAAGVDQNAPSAGNSSQAAQTHIFRLFVAGHGTQTQKTLQHLYQVLETQLAGVYSLQVIDILKDPEQAEVNQISAIPTLLRIWPEPVRRIVGHLDAIALDRLNLKPNHLL